MSVRLSHHSQTFKHGLWCQWDYHITAKHLDMVCGVSDVDSISKIFLLSFLLLVYLRSVSLCSLNSDREDCCIHKLHSQQQVVSLTPKIFFHCLGLWPDIFPDTVICWTSLYYRLFYFKNKWLMWSLILQLHINMMFVIKINYVYKK